MSTTALSVANNAVSNFGTVFTKLADNIANASTDGFKANNSVFADTAGSSGKGNDEPDILTMGPVRPTGNKLDVAIRDSIGMMALGNTPGNEDDDGGIEYFTRDGSFITKYDPDEPNILTLVHQASGRIAQGHTLPLDNPTLANAVDIQVPKSLEGEDADRPLLDLRFNEHGILVARYTGATKLDPPVDVEIARLAVTRLQGHQVQGQPIQNAYRLRPNGYGSTDIVIAKNIATPQHIEGSNINLPDMFTALIVAQKSFQTVTKMMTTSDEMLDTITNLKR